MPAIVYAGEVWCLRENEMGIMRTEWSRVRAMYGVQVKNSK